MHDARQYYAPNPETPPPKARGILLPDGTIHPLAFALMVLVTVFFAYQIVGGVLSVLLFGFPAWESIQGMRIATVVSQVVFLLVPAVFLLRLQPWPLREALRLHRPRFWPMVLVVLSVVAAQFGLQAVMEVQQYALREHLLPDALLPFLDKCEQLLDSVYSSLLIMRTPVEALFVLLVVAVTPAICEEVLFRGTVMYSLERAVRVRWALLLSGVIFAAFHLNPVTFIPLAFLGTWLSVVAWRGNSIAYAIAGHLANNTIAVVSLYLFKADQLLPSATDGSFPLAAMSLGLGIGFPVFCLLAALFWSATKPMKN